MLNMIKYAALMFLFRSHLILCDDGGQLTHQLEPSNDLQKSDEPLQRYATISPIVQRLGGNGNERFRRNSKDPGMNFLRLYLCESGYQNCMADESGTDLPVQAELINQLNQMFKLPSQFWGNKEFNLKNLNLSGQREKPIFADEPSYLLVRTDQSQPQTLALLSGPGPGPDYMDDPFIPQRGRRTLKIVQSKNRLTDQPPNEIVSKNIGFVEKLSRNAIQNLQNGQHKLAKASVQLTMPEQRHPHAKNGPHAYFLPMGHPKMSVDSNLVNDADSFYSGETGDIWKRTPV